MRFCVVLLLLAVPAYAQKKAPSAAQAKASNESAFQRALGKLKVKKIKLATVPADPQESTGDEHYVGNVVFDAKGHHDPTFVVDANKDVFRVVRKINTVGRVKVRVCNAGPPRPIRMKRTRYDVPTGHRFKGDLEVSYDAVVLDEQNTCK